MEGDLVLDGDEMSFRLQGVGRLETRKKKTYKH